MFFQIESYWFFVGLKRMKNMKIKMIIIWENNIAVIKMKNLLKLQNKMKANEREKRVQTFRENHFLFILLFRHFEFEIDSLFCSNSIIIINSNGSNSNKISTKWILQYKTIYFSLKQFHFVFRIAVCVPELQILLII